MSEDLINGKKQYVQSTPSVTVDKFWTASASVAEPSDLASDLITKLKAITSADPACQKTNSGSPLEADQ